MGNIITVNRYKNSGQNPRKGTFGYIEIFGVKVFTIEREWIYDPIKWPSGKNNESCIPEGSYNLIERLSNRKKKKMFYLENQSLGIYNDFPRKKTDRAGCMFHKASRSSHVEGCIGLGLSFKIINNEPVLGKIEEAEQFVMDYIRAFDITKCEIKYI